MLNRAVGSAPKSDPIENELARLGGDPFPVHHSASWTSLAPGTGDSGAIVRVRSIARIDDEACFLLLMQTSRQRCAVRNLGRDALTSFPTRPPAGTQAALHVSAAVA